MALLPVIICLNSKWLWTHHHHQNAFPLAEKNLNISTKQQKRKKQNKKTHHLCDGLDKKAIGVFLFFFNYYSDVLILNNNVDSQILHLCYPEDWKVILFVSLFVPKCD